MCTTLRSYSADALLYSTVQYCRVQYWTVQYCSVLYSTVLYCIVQCIKELYSAVQCSTVQYSALKNCIVLYSAALYRAGRLYTNTFVTSNRGRVSCWSSASWSCHCINVYCLLWHCINVYCLLWHCINVYHPWAAQDGWVEKKILRYYLP